MHTSAALARAPACTAAAAAPQRPGTIGRRTFVRGLFQASAAGASLLSSIDDAAGALSVAPLAQTTSSAAEAGRLARQGSLQRNAPTPVVTDLEHRRSSGEIADLVADAVPICGSKAALRPAMHAQVPKSRLGSATALPTLPLPTSPLPTPPSVLQVQDGAALDDFVASHTRRLLVIHFAIQACPFCDALLPWLAQAAARHPDALFARLAVSAGGGKTAVAGPLLGAQHAAGALPCTLLLWGQTVLAQLATAGGSGAATAAPEAAAASAARDLNQALMAAEVTTRLQHADCATAAPAYA